MPIFVNFSLEFLMSLLVFALMAKWYVWPFLRAREPRQALLMLLSPFLLRYLGLMSLVPGVVDAGVTRSSFAIYQAYGDFIAFVLALVAFVMIRWGTPGALAAVWVANIFGMSEFLHSVIRGAVVGTGGNIGAFWYILVAYVPLGIVAHWMIFVLLVTRAKEWRSPGRAERRIATHA